MKKLLYYTVSASVVGLAAQLAGMSLAAVFMLSLVVPPALLLVWVLTRARGIERKMREDYWTSKRPREW